MKAKARNRTLHKKVLSLRELTVPDYGNNLNRYLDFDYVVTEQLLSGAGLETQIVPSYVNSLKFGGT